MYAVIQSLDTSVGILQLGKLLIQQTLTLNTMKTKSRQQQCKQLIALPDAVYVQMVYRSILHATSVQGYAVTCRLSQTQEKSADSILNKQNTNSELFPFLFYPTQF